MVANKTRLAIKGMAIAAVAATVGLSASAGLTQSGDTIAIDGSSTVYPITEAVAEDFQNANPGINVTIGISGTGGGFEKFCNGETVISNASRPIKEEEREACNANNVDYIELPVAYDALTVVVSARNTWVESMTVEQLAALWSPDSTIDRWSQIDPSFPDEEIVLYGPGTDSGTFDYFTDAIVGEEGASRSDYTASEDDNVLVQGVAGDTNALGYFGFAYYEANQNRLRAVPIDSGDGAVYPSIETVNGGTYVPLSRPLFIYVSTAAADRPEVQQFVEYYLENAAALSEEVGYVGLPAEAYTLAMNNFESRKTGTVFADRETVGVSIETLLELEGAD